MTFSIRKLSQEQWVEHLAESAHFLAFGTNRPGDIERIDFALLMVDENDSASAYITCKEMDSETLYWQYGGAMPKYKETIYAYQGYALFIGWAFDHYKRVFTRIENTNLAMLKLALKLGFVVTGTNTFKGKIYLELLNEFGG